MQLDLLKQEKAKDRAIYVAGAFADPDWYRAAELALEQLINRGLPFTSDGLWYLLDQMEVSTDEPRALGAVINRARKAGRINATGEYRKSTRPECHRRPLTVWRPTR